MASSAALSLVALLAVIYGIKAIAKDGAELAALLPAFAGLGLGAVFVSRQRRLAEASARGLDYLAITDHDDVRSQSDAGFGTGGVIGVPSLATVRLLRRESPTCEIVVAARNAARAMP